MKNYIEKGISYYEYKQLIDKALSEGRTTGETQSAELTDYTNLNKHRMERLDKTTVIVAGLSNVVKNLQVNWVWLILTEGWCGDAAQNIPVIEKIAAENPNIKTRYLLRDENLELMDKYLTDGSRSIPKLICVDAETYEEIGVWGSRPKAADDYFKKLKAEGLAKPEIIENIQRWYLGDKTASIQIEFEDLLKVWEER
ncbi:MAG: thioredoxin family protein [Pyrinomonadaceae bacterium]|nr:thioredoxin family protein [Pyrinomonadaceae bacterium]